jgi:hypothetical protein
MAPDEIQELYARPPEEFTEARNALAADLKERGEAEAAAQVRKLRRPTVAAWAVNQLARQHGPDLKKLIEAGDALREAQRNLSKQGRAELTEASRRRREIVDRLVQAAEDILQEAGRGAARATLDQVADSLLATAVDEEARERVGRGVLEKELPPPAGFGEIGGLEAAREPGAKAETPPEQPSAKDRAREREERRARERAAERAEEAEAAETEARRLEQEADRAERAAATARRQAERARERAEKTRDRADRAARELAERSAG